MTAEVLPLHPGPSATRPLKGLYLEDRLHELGSAQSPFVYGSFVSSLDGRIALVEPGSKHKDVLAGLTTPNDFRLFQELEAQADCLITHGGYLRSLAQGRLGNVLQISAGGQAPDLLEWREQNNLPPQPAIVVASGSLDLPIPASIRAHGQPLYIATGRSADPARVEALRESGLPVIFAGNGTMVEGAPLVRALGELGYRSLYLLAGPKMLETMLRDGQLSRLYLTLRHRLLGGEKFHTLIDGPTLGEAGKLDLRALHYDPGEHPGDGQWFAQFDCTRR
jgi:riboflavin biosynthesis pyrimidine reductase